MTRCEHYTVGQQHPIPNAQSYYPLNVFHLDPTTGGLLPSGVYGYNPTNQSACSAGGNAKVNGIAFDDQGEHAFFTMANATPHLGVLELTTGVVTDLASNYGLSITNPAGKANTHIERNRYDGVSVLCYAHPSGVAILKNVGDLSALTWVENLPVTPALSSSPQGLPVIWDQQQSTNMAVVAPRLLNAQVFNSQSYSTLTSSTCCVDLSKLQAEPCIYSWTGQNTAATPWAPGSNGFTDSPLSVILAQDFVVEPGAVLYVQDMTWRFLNNARLIIRPGAKAIFNHSVLTSINCIGERWPGVRVEGTTSDHSQSQSGQGRLTLSNSSEVQNAVTGVWCAREVTPGIAHPAFFGGWVLAYNSIFRNCNTGVRIESYVRHNSNNDEAHNLCLFSNCSFINDLDWPVAGGSPVAMAYLYDVNGVFFGGCEFRNDASALMPDPDLRGMGIVSWASSFTSLGNMDYPMHGFRNLTAGVLTWDTDPMFLTEVDGMDFVNNKFGIIDFGSDDGVYTNNQFATLSTDALNGETSIGLYLIQSERYTVERNLFTKPSGAIAPGVGIWFIGPAYENNRIYDNTFNDLNVGCLVQGDHVANVPGGQGNTLDGLQMLCGDHTGNYVDQMILLDGYIKENQGNATDITTLAGNRFFSSVDCDGNGAPNPSFEPWVFPGHAQDLHVDYFHHDGMLSPASEPECVIGSWIDTYYDLILPFPYSGVAFDKDVHCAGGDLEFTNGGDHLQLLVDYNAKILEVASTLANYQGTVDNGEMPDLITAIRYQPWHPSHYVRDLLLAKQPLSDEVMLEAIARVEPLDPWHLTQILIDNSPVTDDIWLALDASGVLPPYFYGLLQQFRTGMSTRRLFEMELIRRKEEKAILQHRLLVAINTDTTLTGTTALIDSIFMADSLGRGTRYRYQLALHRADFSNASALEAMFNEEADASGIVQLGQLRSALSGNWHTANASQRADLLELAYADDVQASAHAWAVSMAIGETDSLPQVYLPLAYRSAYFAPKPTQSTTAQPLLQALPNPSPGQVLLTYPKEFTEGTITVLDLQGKIVAQYSITGHRAMLELDLEHLSPGLYIARLEAEGIPVGEVKISLVK
jgi:hypothetical protein